MFSRWVGVIVVGGAGDGDAGVDRTAGWIATGRGGAGCSNGAVTMTGGRTSTATGAETVTVAAGMAALRVQVARSRTIWRPTQNMSS
jgi:hypothetical protein